MIVLDCGQVLTDHGDAMTRMAAVLGVDADVLSAEFWGLRRPYDAGQSDRDYWSAVAAALGIGIDDDTVRRLVDIDLGTWSRLRPGSRAVLEGLAAAGTPAMMLSNAPVGFRAHLERAGWTHLLRELVISGEEGCVKPDPELYRITEERAGDEEIWFVDDREHNVDAARARGWHAHLWVDDADSAAWLRAEGFLS